MTAAAYRSPLRWAWVALLVLLLLSAGLRFYRLDAQSFWNDEGNTARLVERPIPLIIAGAAGDIHPPGYYLLLHAWRALLGETEFALRGFSAFCGLLTVAAAAAMGRRVGGWRVAVGAAAFVTFHPLAVYYSQEARMYALLGLVSALTFLAALELQRDLRAPRFPLRPMLWLALMVALGLYTQYTYALVLFGLNLAFGLDWLLRRPWRWRDWLPWLGAHLLGGLLFLPWAPHALRALRWRPPDLDTTGALPALLRTQLTGLTLPESAAPYLLPMAGGLLLLALLSRPRSRLGAWAAVGMALTPPVLIAALGIYRPAYLKFLLATLAPLGVLLALPLSARDWRARWLAITLLVALLPAQGMALYHLYHDPAYARDDYRDLAAHLAAVGQSGDAIILSAPNQWEVFTYYYHGPAPVYPAPYHPTEEEALDFVAAITAEHSQLHVIYWGDAESDPQRLVETALATQAYKAGEAWRGTLRVARYGVSALPVTPTVALRRATLGDEIALLGYSLPATRYPVGAVVPLTLHWQAWAIPEARLKVFVQLLNAEGQLVAQVDAEPVGGFRPTTSWQPGELLHDRYGVPLPATLPPGTYTLITGLYHFSGERLPVTVAGEPAGDYIVLTYLSLHSTE